MHILKKIYFVSIILLMAFIAYSHPLQEATTSESQRPLLIKQVRLFDGEKTLQGVNVLVQNGKIAAIGPKVEAPANAAVIEGAGKTLLPGLIDSHIHTITPDALKQALFFGITSVVDMFMDVSMMKQFKAKQEAGQANDQAFLTSPGTLATAPGGHGTQYGLAISTLTRPEEAQAWVDARISEGSDFIKIILDDLSSYDRKQATLDMPTVSALIAAAHKKGKMAVIHAATLKNCQDSLRAGVDGLVHLYFDGAFDPKFGQLAAEKHAFVIPTLCVIEAAGNKGDADVSLDPRMIPYLKKSDLDALNYRYLNAGTKVAWELRQRVIQQLRSAKVPILAGTDAPNPGTLYGASLHHELLLLVQAGLTPEQALQAATSVPADKFHIANRGRVKAGYAADLLLVNGDPTADIKATRDIISIWHNGVRVDREKYRQEVEADKHKIEKLKTAPPPANSESGWISDFEEDTVRARFGAGLEASTDVYMGGKSKAELKLAPGGARGSGKSLLVTGTLDSGGSYNWSGVIFYPGSVTFSPANLSAWKGIDFWAKGDAREYTVMIFAQALGYKPATRTFQVGPEWQEYTLSFADFGIEGYDIMGIFIGASGQPGGFSLQLDDLRLK